MSEVAEKPFVSTTEYLEEKRSAREAAPKPKLVEPAQAEEIDDEAAPEMDDAPVETESEPDTQSGDDTGEELEEANLEGDEQEQATEPETAIQAPDFWDAEGKDAFAKLPPEAQKAILPYEQQRTAAVARKLNEFAEVGKQYQAKREQLDTKITELSQFVSETDKELTEYEGIDWQLEIAEATTQEQLQFVMREQARFEALKQAKTTAAKAEEEARALDLREHHETVKMQLKALAPHLDFDTKEGVQRIQVIDRYLEGQGIDNATRAWMPAQAMVIADKAFQYDLQQWKAKKSAQPKPVTQKPAAGPSVKPASTGASAPVSQRLAALDAKKELSQAEYLERRRLVKRASKRKR